MPSWVSKKAPCPHEVRVVDEGPPIVTEVTSFPADPRYIGCTMEWTPEEFSEQYEICDQKNLQK